MRDEPPEPPPDLVAAFKKGRNKPRLRPTIPPAVPQLPNSPNGSIPVDQPPTPAELEDDDWAREEHEHFREGNYHRVEVERRLQILGMRGTWSAWLIVWITYLILYQTILGVFIGASYLTFEKNPYVLGFLLGQNFLQILGMGYIVVKWLFPLKPDAVASLAADQ